MWFERVDRDLQRRVYQRVQPLNYYSFTYFIFLIYEWDITRFSNVPRGYWENTSNQRNFLDSVAKKLNITDAEGWHAHYRKGLKQKLLEFGGSQILKMYRTIPNGITVNEYY